MTTLKDIFPQIGMEEMEGAGGTGAALSREALFTAPVLVPAKGRVAEAERRETFLRRARARHITCLRPRPGAGGIEAAVTGYLAAEDLEKRPLVIPDRKIRALCPGLESTDPFDVRNMDGAVLVSGCDGAVAETGSLFFGTRTTHPAAGMFLADTHVVLLPARRILGSFEDFFPPPASPLPQALHIISGPSATADIELQLVEGAHGPLRLCVVLLEEEDISSR